MMNYLLVPEIIDWPLLLKNIYQWLSIIIKHEYMPHHAINSRSVERIKHLSCVLWPAKNRTISLYEILIVSNRVSDLGKQGYKTSLTSILGVYMQFDWIIYYGIHWAYTCYPQHQVRIHCRESFNDNNSGDIIILHEIKTSTQQQLSGWQTPDRTFTHCIKTKYIPFLKTKVKYLKS